MTGLMPAIPQSAVVTPAQPDLGSKSSTVTMEDLIAFVAKNEINDARLWNHLDCTDGAKLSSLLDQLDSVDAEIFDTALHAPMTKKQFETDKSARKGKLFEDFSAALLSGIKCFGVHSNVTSATNQLDLLVKMGPASTLIPAFKKWGTHFVCECKFHESGVSNTWLNKLNSILQLHGANVGILIAKKGMTRVGRAGNLYHLIQLMAMKDTFILVFSRDELRKSAKNGTVLQSLVDKFIASQMGIAKLLTE